MAQVPAAVIGLGFIGSRWARALAEHDAARLAVVSDLREDLGKDVAERYGARFVPDPRCTAADGVEAVRLALAVERANEREEVVYP